MTNKQRRFFAIARQVSHMSDFARVKIGAVVVENSRIISTGHNSNKTSTIQYRYNFYRGINDLPECKHKLHAEIAALAPLLHKPDVDWRHTSIYVYRELKNGIISCARPCPACARLIKELGIRHIYYSDWNGTFVHEEQL